MLFRISDYLGESVLKSFEFNINGKNFYLAETNRTIPFDYDQPMNNWDKSKSNFWLVHEAKLS